METTHLSWTQLNMLWRCPRQYEYRYVKEIILPPTAFVFLGGSIHIPLEKNYQQKVESKQDLPLNDILDIFSDSWEKREASEIQEVNWEDKPEAQLKDLGVELITLYQKRIAVNTQPLAATYRIEKPVDENLTFISILDLLLDQTKIADIKVSAYRMGRKVDQDMQPTAYAYALGTPIEWDYHTLIRTKVDIEIEKTKRTQEEIDWFANSLTHWHKQIQSGIFPPRPGDWQCQPEYCGYHILCKTESTQKIFTS